MGKSMKNIIIISAVCTFAAVVLASVCCNSLLSMDMGRFYYISSVMG